MIPRRLALALEFRDIRRQLVEVNFRGSRYRADLKTESRKEKHLMGTEKKRRTRASGRIRGDKTGLSEKNVEHRRINRPAREFRG